MAHHDVDVLIVGAGPVGLLMAHELRRHGVERVRVIDDRTGPSLHSKAIGIQPRTSELLALSGLYPAFEAEARSCYAMRVHKGDKVLASFDLASMDSPTPVLLVLPQYDTERLLEDATAARGVTVERETRLESLAQDVDGVDAVVRDPEGRHRTVRARWLIGCDGAHSTTRDQIGVPYEGEDLGTHIAFLDAMATWDRTTEELALFLDEDGFCIAAPLPTIGLWRLIATVPAGAQVQHELAWFQDLLGRRIPDPPRLDEAIWMTDFRVRQRKVDRFRVGRVFLAGDSAHVHSPLGGRGMNTGLQDAWNLAWKLALVNSGRGRSDLLDSYSAEREPVARALLTATGRQTRMATLRHPVHRAVRNTMMSVLTSFDGVRDVLRANATQLDIEYPSSPIVGERTTPLVTALGRGSSDGEIATVRQRQAFAAGPAPGARAPDVVLDDDAGVTLHGLMRGSHHTVLLFDGEAATAAGYETLHTVAVSLTDRYRGLLRPVVLVPGDDPPDSLDGVEVVADPWARAHGRYGAASECLYVVRPDGHIGFRSQPVDADALDTWLREVFVS